MTLLIACGFQKNWCGFVSNRLSQMGIEPPISSPRSTLSFSTLLSKIAKHHELCIQDAETIRPIDPGRAWQISIADMLLANSEQENWALSDNRNVFFLDFWQDFDPKAKFVLVYGSLEKDLASFVSEVGWDGNLLSRRILGWQVFYSEMLRFYHRHPDRCLLVHIDRFEEDASEVAERIQSKFGIETQRSLASERVGESVLLELISREAVREFGFSDDVYPELECSADLPAVEHSRAKSIGIRGISEHQHFITVDRKSREQKAESDEEILKLGEEIRLLRTKLAAESSVSIEHQPSAPDENAQDFILENELLQKQLRQVEEELEKYFRSYHELKQNSRPHELAEHSGGAVDRVQMDLRDYLQGSGWHNAEGHGRWAGEELKSTINLPALVTGTYEVRIEVVDTMTMEILKNTQVSFNGESFKPKIKWLSNKSGLLAPLRRARASMNGAMKPLPGLLCVRVIVSSLGQKNMLSIDCPGALSPAKLGASDTRPLSVCVKSLTLTRVH